MRAVLVLDKKCSYKWYSSRLIFPRINDPIVSIHRLFIQHIILGKIVGGALAHPVPQLRDP